MDSRIQLRKEPKRGCGFRKDKGALYLVDLDPANFKPCGKLPFAVGPCPCCGEGIKPARQWVWVEADKLLEEAKARPCPQGDDVLGCPCPMDSSETIGRAGLLWIGDKFYSADNFLKEAKAMGFSRRVAFVPKGFEIGKTWVLLGHIRAYKGEKGAKPGILAMFQPKAVEVICDGNESKAEVDRLVERGLTPVLIDNGGAGEAEKGELL